MRSIHHRGTPEAPGLVLALDRDEAAACAGVAFRLREGEEDAVLDYLRDRELISSAYLEQRHPVRLAGGDEVVATTFVVDRDHVQYCGGLPLAEQAGIIARAAGGRGPNDEYLLNTHRHLADLGIRDPDLDWLEREVRRLVAGTR
jgi:cation transport protein ChaC